MMRIYDESCVVFVRANVLTRRFANCSKDVKITLFKSYCLCFYDVALWSSFSSGALNKLNLHTTNA